MLYHSIVFISDTCPHLINYIIFMACKILKKVHLGCSRGREAPEWRTVQPTQRPLPKRSWSTTPAIWRNLYNCSICWYSMFCDGTTKKNPFYYKWKVIHLDLSNIYHVTKIQRRHTNLHLYKLHFVVHLFHVCVTTLPQEKTDRDLTVPPASLGELEGAKASLCPKKGFWSFQAKVKILYLIVLKTLCCHIHQLYFMVMLATWSTFPVKFGSEAPFRWRHAFLREVHTFLRERVEDGSYCPLLPDGLYQNF